MKLGFLERCYVNSRLRHWLQRPFEVRLVTTLVPFPAGAQVVDFGCGNGAGLGLLAQAVGPASLTGVDADPAQLARARNLLARRHIAAQLVEADVTRVPLPAHSVDVITSFGCLHHVERWPAALAEAGRLLRHGGLLYALEFYRPLLASWPLRALFPHPPGRFTQADLAAELPRHGFTVLAQRSVGGLAGFTVARLTDTAPSYD